MFVINTYFINFAFRSLVLWYVWFLKKARFFIWSQIDDKQEYNINFGLKSYLLENISRKKYG